MNHEKDFKSWIIPDLKNLEAKKKSLEHSLEEIKLLEEAFVAIKATTFDKDVVDGGENTQEDARLDNILRRQTLDARCKITKGEIEAVESVLNELDEEDQLILNRLFIHTRPGAIDTLKDELNVEIAQIYRKRERALRNYARIACGGQVIF